MNMTRILLATFVYIFFASYLVAFSKIACVIIYTSYYLHFQIILLYKSSTHHIQKACTAFGFIRIKWRWNEDTENLKIKFFI